MEQQQKQLSFSLKAESLRFYAYMAFWGMSAFAMIISELFVAPLLAAGPKIEGDTCGPFNRDWPEEGIVKGMGFDFNEQNHLVQLFGYGNICANWDYSPARELTAMVYPLFEFLLLMYVLVSYWADNIAYKKGRFPEAFWKFTCIAFYIEVFLIAQFRMIFVCISYENIQQHTAGFLGLQITLTLIAIHNSASLLYTKSDFMFGSQMYTKVAAIAYLLAVIPIDILKLGCTTYIVLNGYGAAFTLEQAFGGFKVGQVIDLSWMLFNALLPIFLSWKRMRHEQPISILITQEDDVCCIDDDSATPPVDCDTTGNVEEMTSFNHETPVDCTPQDMSSKDVDMWEHEDQTVLSDIEHTLQQVGSGTHYD